MFPVLSPISPSMTRYAILCCLDWNTAADGGLQLLTRKTVETAGTGGTQWLEDVCIREDTKPECSNVHV